MAFRKDYREDYPLPPVAPLTEIIPAEAGLASEARAVGRRIADFLNNCERFSWAIANGKLIGDIQRFRMDVIDRLRAEGWRISVDLISDKWLVLPPEDYGERISCKRKQGGTKGVES